MAWTRGSGEVLSFQPPGPGVRELDVERLPGPSQTQWTSVPGMICISLPLSIWRISMKRVSKIGRCGGWNATRSAVPSHSTTPPYERLGSPLRSTYNPNSVDSLGLLQRIYYTLEAYHGNKEETRFPLIGTSPY